MTLVLPPGPHLAAPGKKPRDNTHHTHPADHSTGPVPSMIPVIKRFPTIIQSVSLDSYRKTLNYRQKWPVGPSAPLPLDKVAKRLPGAVRSSACFKLGTAGIASVTVPVTA
jgi:hypothetical protein